MAAKVKKAYFCRECGYDTAKWLGKCPSCGAWNSFAEEVVSSPSSVPALVASHALEPARPQKVQEIECGKTVRIDTGIGYDKDEERALFDYVKSLGVEYHVEPTQIYQVVFEERKEKNPCSLCANMRRGALNSTAKKCTAAAVQKF